jgi:hypothetical protein
MAGGPDGTAAAWDTPFCGTTGLVVEGVGLSWPARTLPGPGTTTSKTITTTTIAAAVVSTARFRRSSLLGDRPSRRPVTPASFPTSLKQG